MKKQHSPLDDVKTRAGYTGGKNQNPKYNEVNLYKYFTLVHNMIVKFLTSPFVNFRVCNGNTEHGKRVKSNLIQQKHHTKHSWNFFIIISGAIFYHLSEQKKISRKSY